MRQVVNGNIYDTETSTLAGTKPNGNFFGKDYLYRSQSGLWFIVHTGLGEGNQFWPINEDKAYDWLHRNNDIESLKRFFPERVNEV